MVINRRALTVTEVAAGWLVEYRAKHPRRMRGRDRTERLIADLLVPAIGELPIVQAAQYPRIYWWIEALQRCCKARLQQCHRKGDEGTIGYDTDFQC